MTRMKWVGFFFSFGGGEGWVFFFNCCSVSKSAACQASLSFTVSQNLLKLMSIELVMVMPPTVSSCHPLLNLSRIRVFSSELALCIRWPKYWSFSFSISLISFRIDWFDFLSVQGTLSLLQDHSLKASILQHLAFFMVQLSHLYMTIGNIVTLCGPLSISF